MNAELQLAINQFNKLKATLSKSTDVSEINKLNTEIGLLTNKINQLGGSVTNTGRAFSSNLKVASNNAAFALNDVNRVVQDLPYGFIGISNNINPLVESFGRLRAESQTNGEAFSKLFQSLSGPGGVALGFSLVTTALTFAEVGLSRWIRSSKDTSSELGHLKQVISELEIATKASKVEFDNYATSLDRIQELSKLDIRLNITGIGDIADYNRQLALLKLEKETLTEKIGGGVSVFGPGVGTGVVKNLIEARNVLEQFNNIVSSKAPATYTNTLIGNATDAKLAYDKVIESFGGLDNAYLATDEQLSNLNDEQKTAIKAYGNQQKVVQDLEKQLGDLNQQLRINEKTTQVVQQVEKDRLAALQKDLPSVDKLLAKLNEDIRDQQELSIVFDIPTIQEQFNLVKTAITKLVTDFNLSPEDSRILDLKVRLEDYAAQLAELRMQAKRDNVTLAIKLEAEPEAKVPDFAKNLKFSSSFLQYKASIEKAKKDAQDIQLQQLADLNNLVYQFSQQAAAGFGELLGQTIFAAISGQTSGLADAFKGLFTLFGNAVIALGKYAIEYSTAIQALKQAIKSAGASGIAIGIGLIALGVLIKAAAGGIGKAGAFAVGTNYAPGGMALVGERGPELINLPRGSQVVPAAQTSNIMKGAVQQVQVYGVLRGQDIYFSNKKYSQTYNRTT